MNHILNIMRKEIKEMLTPGSVISVLVMVVLFAGLGGLINSEVDKASEMPTIGYIGPTDGEFHEWNIYTELRDMYGPAADYKIILIDGSDVDSIMKSMDDNGLSTVISVPSDIYSELGAGNQVSISQYYLYEPTGMFGSISSTVTTMIVSSLNTSLSKILIDEGSSSTYEFVTNPLVSGNDQINTIVNGVPYQGITPYDISSEVTNKTMMIPLVIMMIIIMVGSIVISSMGSEKENKTLETLLTLPIKRTSIVSGKILAASVVGLVYGLAYLVGMSIYMNAMTSSMSTGSVDLDALGMSLDTMDWILIMISMFLAIVCALGMCMVLGAFAKNYKSAQTMMMPLSILAMIPMFITMFSGWYGSGMGVKAITFAIPFSHPMMAMQALMYGDVSLVLAGIAYTTVFAVAMIAVTVWLYRSDILITGLGQNKLVQKLTGKE